MWRYLELEEGIGTSLVRQWKSAVTLICSPLGVLNLATSVFSHVVEMKMLDFAQVKEKRCSLCMHIQNMNMLLDDAVGFFHSSNMQQTDDLTIEILCHPLGYTDSPSRLLSSSGLILVELQTTYIFLRRQIFFFHQQKMGEFLFLFFFKGGYSL